jgi:hypothetical protein
MKKLTNGKHVYPPKNSLVEYSKDHLWTWEIVVALTIQFSEDSLPKRSRL